MASTFTTAKILRHDEMRSDTPLSAAYDSYLRSKRRIGDKTRSWYATYLNAYANWLIRLGRAAVVGDVSQDLVEAFLDDYRKRPTKKYARGSAFSERAAAVTLKTFANWLAKNRILADDRGDSVLSAVENAKVDQDVRQPLSNEDVQRLLQSAGRPGSMERALVVFMLGTGLRLNEAREARVADIDLDNCTFTVRPETSKFDRSRVAYFHRDVAFELDRYLRGREDDWYSDSSGSPLFPNSSGRLYTDDGWDKVFQRLKERSGIPQFSAHRLRHTWATQFMRSGGDLLDLKRQGGWKKWEMVERYSHAIPPRNPDLLPNPLSVKAPSVKRLVVPRFHKSAVA